MLHILLTILKIIGILILVLLGLVLVIVLSVLLIPICYEVQGSKEEKNIQANAAVSWLFRCITARYVYKEKEGNFEVYIFGIPLFASRNKMKRRKAEKEKKVKEQQEKKKAEVPMEKAQPEKEEVPIQANVETSKPQITENKNIKKTEEEKQQVILEKEVQQKSVKQPTEKKLGLGDKIKSLWNTICGLPKKLSSVWKKIRLTCKRIYDKIDWWKSFFQKESTQKAIRFLLGQGKVILKHVLPRKLRGSVLYGFEDPATTGQMLAVLSILYPIYQDDLEIIPFFDREILEGNLKITGRIFLGFILIHAIKIIINREIQQTYKNFRRKEA